METIQGHVAIVTGAGRGMGRAIALAVAKAGAKVVATALEPPEVTATVDEIRRAGGEATAIGTDLAQPGAVERVFEQTLKMYGKVHVLVNCAGMYRWLPVLDTPKAEALKIWETIMAVNVAVPFRACLEAIPHMVQQGGGTIVNIASTAGLFGGHFPGAAAYAASKAALAAFCGCVAPEVEAKGIKMYTVCPGGVRTQMQRDHFAEMSPDLLLEPEDIAQVVVAIIAGKTTARPGEPVIVSKGWPVLSSRVFPPSERVLD